MEKYNCRPPDKMPATFIGFVHCMHCHPRPDFKHCTTMDQYRAEKAAWFNATPQMKFTYPKNEGEDREHLHTYCDECKRAICHGYVMGEDD